MIILAAGCAPHRPPLPIALPTTYRAVGTFQYKGPNRHFSGMWDMIYKGQGGYRIALYSPLGTLEACVSFQSKKFVPCGGKGLASTEVLKVLPPTLLAHLPEVLLGHIPQGKIQKDSHGRTVEARLTVGEAPWTISYQHYLEEGGTQYPTLVEIKGQGVALKIRIEELTPNWTPSPG